MVRRFTLSRLLAQLRPHLGRVGVAYLAMFVLNLTTVAYAAMLGPALHFMFTGDARTVTHDATGELRPFWHLVPSEWVTMISQLGPSHRTAVLPALVIILAALKGLSQTVQFYLFGCVSQRVLHQLRLDVFASLMRQSPTFFAHRSLGDLLSRLGNDAADVERAYFYGLGSLLRDSLAVVGLFAYVFYSDPQLAFLTFLIVPAAVLPLVRFARWLKQVAKGGQVAQSEVMGIAAEALGGAVVVQAFGNEGHEVNRLGKASDRYRRLMQRSYLVRATRSPLMEVLGALALGALLYFLGRHVQATGADAAHYVSFLGAIFLMYDPLKKLGKVSDYLVTGAAAAERLFELLDSRPDVTDAPHAKELVLSHRAPTITFEGVRFAYRAPNGRAERSPCEETNDVLKGIHLRLESGQCVALVGPSGGGKTTIAQLLARFYDLPSQGGAICVNGHDLRDLTLTSWRRCVALVTQETFLFSGTVRDNIAYGRLGASEEDILRAAVAAQADVFIRELPHGYDTVLGERGVTLSGGQRQRLAIARAFLADAKVLILDEATSHLDVESERALQLAMHNLLRGRTSLIIAHRLSTVRHADLICVIKDGRITERGSHHELLARGGDYAQLYALDATTHHEALANEGAL